MGASSRDLVLGASGLGGWWLVVGLAVAVISAVMAQDFETFGDEVDTEGELPQSDWIATIRSRDEAPNRELLLDDQRL